MVKYTDIEYLKYGNEKQKNTYDLLVKYDIFNILDKYNPILAGTIPISIDIDKSDLDIICEVYDFQEFSELIKYKFSNKKEFKIQVINPYTMVINFWIDNFELEIYGENKKTIDQNAYRHMIIEDRILEIGGEFIKNKIIALKKSGFKTEPAFAKLLGLKGNSYVELFKLESMSDLEIKKLIKGEK